MFIVIKVFLDAAVILLSYLAAYSLKFHQGLSGISHFPWDAYGKYVFWIVLVYLGCFNFSGMYRERKGILIEIDEFLGCLNA